MLDEFCADTATVNPHTVSTHLRVVKMYKEMFSGVGKNVNDELSTMFESKADQMIVVADISFYSMCAHHLIPFFGKASFAYIPNGKIVGLSKIPRLVDMLARRPQVQEQMSDDIVDAFMMKVEPLGCGVHINAQHLCCMARGIKQPTAYMETTSLRGNFKEASVKAEFLQAVRS
jgi:GTP cyclohydrolase I